MLNFKPLLSLCALAVSAFAQGNLQTAQLTHSENYDKWFVHNATTDQTITAYIYHAGDEPMRLLNGQNVGVGELKNDLMLPGTSRDVAIKPGYHNVEIVAVVFADGHVSGAATTVEGIDLVQSAIFDNRRLEFLEWKTVAAQIAAEPSHRKAFDDYFKSAGPSSPGNNAAEVAHFRVMNEVRGLAWIAAKHPTFESRYQNLVTAVADKVDAAERLATRREK